MRIALFGPICSGKSTIAKHLEKDNNFKIFNFAGKVKKYCKEIFNMEYKDRALLQDFANKCRDIRPTVWVDLVEKEIIKHKNSNIVIDDLRYPNELEMLKRHNFTIIKLYISRNLQIERLKITYPKTYKEHLERLGHKSESHYNNMAFDKKINIVKNENMKEVQNKINKLIYV